MVERRYSSNEFVNREVDEISKAANLFHQRFDEPTIAGIPQLATVSTYLETLQREILHSPDESYDAFNRRDRQARTDLIAGAINDLQIENPDMAMGFVALLFDNPEEQALKYSPSIADTLQLDQSRLAELSPAFRQESEKRDPSYVALPHLTGISDPEQQATQARTLAAVATYFTLREIEFFARYGQLAQFSPDRVWQILHPDRDIDQWNGRSPTSSFNRLVFERAQFVGLYARDFSQAGLIDDDIASGLQRVADDPYGTLGSGRSIEEALDAFEGRRNVPDDQGFYRYAFNRNLIAFLAEGQRAFQEFELGQLNEPGSLDRPFLAEETTYKKFGRVSVELGTFIKQRKPQV